MNKLIFGDPESIRKRNEYIMERTAVNEEDFEEGMKLYKVTFYYEGKGSITVCANGYDDAIDRAEDKFDRYDIEYRQSDCDVEEIQ